MTFYATVLFVHIVSMLGIAAALSYEVLILFRLQRCRNVSEAYIWSAAVPGLQALIMISVVSVLASGIYLTIPIKGWRFAWLDIALVSFFAMAPLGESFSAGVRTIRSAVANGNVAAGGKYGSFAPGSALRLSLGVRIAVLLGIILLMTAKPPAEDSVLIIGLSAGAGLLAGRGKNLIQRG